MIFTQYVKAELMRCFSVIVKSSDEMELKPPHRKERATRAYPYRRLKITTKKKTIIFLTRFSFSQVHH